MFKFVLIIAAIGALGWFGYQQLDFDESTVPAGPSVGYPTVDAGDGVSGLGDKTGGVLGP